MPRLTVDVSEERTVVLEIDGEIPPRLIGIVWPRDRYRPAAANRFVDVARAVCVEFERSCDRVVLAGAASR
jgi:DNA-binding transcriptional LysR family regulator